MHIIKNRLFKLFPAIVTVISLMLATSTVSFNLFNNGYHSSNTIFSDSSQSDRNSEGDELKYIRKNVQEQTGETNPIASIELAESQGASYHSAALVKKTDGSTLLYMWGYNRFGQLGNEANSGTENANPTPTKVAINSASPIVQIALGYGHSAVLLEDGSLYMWGKNDFGQLGNGKRDDTSTPTLVTIPNSTSQITKIAVGHNYSAAILGDGSLHMWGKNDFGQLGFAANTTNNSIPIKVNSADLNGKKATQIALYSDHSAAIYDGNLYMWGRNNFGQLGFVPNGSAHNPTPTPVDSTPFGNNKISQVALGYAHSAALLDDGSLYMWGNSEYGQLGFEANNRANAIPIQVNPQYFTAGISQIAVGHYYSAAILDDGSLYTWGNNKYGQLGKEMNSGTTEQNPVPTIVGITDSGLKVIRIAFGFSHFVALLEDGSLYMWGTNQFGQLGNTTNNGSSSEKFSFTPTWMFQLGKDSHITPKSATITAKTALDNLWVGDKFNLTGFKNSFNLVNIPNINDETFIFDSKPICDNIDGTITMKVKINYFYDEDGLIVTNTAANMMVIGGFKKIPLLTNITAITTVVNSVVVDKWLAYVTVDEKISREKLTEFLVISFVPDDAEFVVSDLNPINKTGVLTFNISSTKFIDGNEAIRNTLSDPFIISLDLTPRITKMVPKPSGNYPDNLTIEKLKAILFDETGLVDLSILNDYMTIIAPVDGATYHLLDGSWEPNADGRGVKFSIWVDKYYDADSNEQKGSSSTDSSIINLNLYLADPIVPKSEEAFPWWWVLVGAGAIAVIGVSIWLIIRKRKNGMEL